MLIYSIEFLIFFAVFFKTFLKMSYGFINNKNIGIYSYNN